MKKNIFFLLAHQDDEIGIFQNIINENKKNKIFVIYLTKGGETKKQMLLRNKESLNGLKELGVDSKNIFFINNIVNVNEIKLVFKIQKVIKILEKKFFQSHYPNVIYSHAWEGGHPDHDSAFLISYYFYKKLNIKLYTFPLYNCENLKWPLFNAFVPVNKNGRILKKKYSETNYIKLFKFMMSYKSQFFSLLGLYPFLLLRIFLFKTYFIQTMSKTEKLSKPHSNVIMYEQRKIMTWMRFNSIVKKLNIKLIKFT
jgi:hypothetical protein